MLRVMPLQEHGGAKRFISSKIREDYLSDKETGVASALRNAIKSLYCEPRLPDNPYHYLARLLYAYADHAPLWKTDCIEVAKACDAEARLEVIYGDSKLCTLKGSKPCCYGLPHVLRAVSQAATGVLHDVLTQHLPDNFFPKSTPFGTEDGYMVQVMASVQAVTAMWRPRHIAFPELDVRCDVLIRGPRLQEALKIFIDLILTEIEEVHSVPLHFVDGVAFLEAAAVVLEGGQEPLYVWWPLEDLLAKPQEFENMGTRLIMGGKVVRTRCVVLVEVPANDSQKDKSIRYEMAEKTYVFHYQSDDEVEPEAQHTSHYGTLPFEALYGGYFMDFASAKQYMAMYESQHGRNPYHTPYLQSNEDSIKRQVEQQLVNLEILPAFVKLLLFILLQDVRMTDPPVLTLDAVLELQDLVQLEGEGAGGRDSLMGALPNLMRILASQAAVLEGCCRELTAISIAAARWPQKQAAILAGAPKGTTPHATRPAPQRAAWADASSEEAPEAAAVETPSTLGKPQTSGAMLAWMRTFNLQSHLLMQLQQLKTRASAVTGKDLFGGISVLVSQLLQKVPTEVPLTGSAALVQGLRNDLAALHQLMHAAALTLSNGFLERCPDVLLALLRMGVQVTTPGEQTFAGKYQDKLYTPDWVLDVPSVTTAMVTNGGLPDRVGTEGVMLQYAADTRLDELLATLWTTLAAPPLAANPYPKLLHIIRARGAKMELWREDGDMAMSDGSLLNELSLFQSPSFMYAARRRPPPARGGAVGVRQQLQQQAAEGVDDDDTAVAYGCYSAVALADPGVVHALRSRLAMLLADRSWKQGGYQADVVPALGGDTMFTNAYNLADVPVPQPTHAQADRSAEPAPYEHTRFFGVTAEEHHLVTGAQRSGAAEAFAQDILASCEALHRSSPHLVHSVSVTGRVYGARVWDDPPRLKALAADLADAALQTSDGVALGSVKVYVALKDGIYVPLTRRLFLQFRPVVPVFEALSPAQDVSSRPTTAERLKQFWDHGVYTRVFMSESDAMKWYWWNRERGDPSQPFHSQRMIDEVSKDAKRQQGLGDLLEAQRLELLAAVVAQDAGKMYHYTRCCVSAAQELRVLQEMNTALVELTDAQNHPELTAQLNHEAVRRLFLMYHSRMSKAMFTPRYNYFLGLSIKVPQHLKELKNMMLASVKQQGRFTDLMGQLHLLTKSCEISVAAAVFASVQDDRVSAQRGLPEAPHHPAHLAASLAE